MTYRAVVIQGMVFLGLGLAAAPSWPQAPARDASSPPVMQELDRLTEQEAQTGERRDSGGHFEAKKRERLIQMLQLDEATRGKLLQRLEQLDQKADALRRERREAFQALRDQAKGLRGELRKGERKTREGNQGAGGTAPSDNPALKASLDRVYAAEDAMAGLRRERLQIVRDLLTPEQQVKFLMYSVRLHREMRERLEREQGGVPGRRGPEASGESTKP